jgi:hypothetical protein
MAVIALTLGTILTVLTIIERIKTLMKKTDRKVDALEAINHAIERVAVAIELSKDKR